LNEAGKAVKGAKIAVLGLAYKGNIDDDRESPSYELIKLLKRLGADIRIYDPYLPKKSTVPNLDEALEDADAVLIATSHNEFKNVTPELLREKNITVLVDGRNFLSKDDFTKAGITYKGIGR
jgi:UDP-N-acetyl-D-mannosaminuronic acid dehydrogenase